MVNSYIFISHLRLDICYIYVHKNQHFLQSTTTARWTTMIQLVKGARAMAASTTKSSYNASIPRPSCKFKLPKRTCPVESCPVIITIPQQHMKSFNDTLGKNEIQRLLDIERKSKKLLVVRTGTIASSVSHPSSLLDPSSRDIALATSVAATPSVAATSATTAKVSASISRPKMMYIMRTCDECKFATTRLDQHVKIKHAFLSITFRRVIAYNIAQHSSQ